MNIFLSVLVLLIALGAHELGHFLTMRAFGIPVQDFTLGLGPTYTLFRAGGAEFRVGPIPLGGYVRPLNDEGQYNQSPAWQRLLVSAAGPAFGLLLAGLLFAGLLLSWGRGPLDSLVGGFHVLGEALAKLVPQLAHESAKVYTQASVKDNFTFVEQSTPADFVIYLAAASIGLSVINLLPIPPLDGGRILLEAYEWVTRRRPHVRVEVGLMVVGALFVLSIWLAGAYNDLAHFWK